MSAESDSNRYARAKTIALEAIDQPAAHRGAWIAKACGNDKDLMAEVEWLIEAAEDGSGDEIPERFQATAAQVVREVSLEVPLPRNYRLLRRLDEGGSGFVYLAERTDGDLHQPVALKMLHLATQADPQLEQRFMTERSILARLNHPNIARLIDAGLTADGRPFLATEFVDGLPIDQWCRQHAADFEQRLGLFLKVCDAVDYAHRHMVIHRDLKPHNILVGEDGEPKLLDFGIARLLDQDPTAAGQDSGSMLTIAYASPEQLSGQGLNAATDVFSLGVVLYELISEQRPFTDNRRRLECAAHGQAERIESVCDRLAVRLARTLAIDLDAIVSRALQARPDQRYRSVRDLADDLERLRDRKPVRARGDDWAYRLRRLIGRQRWALATILAVVALTVVFFLDREAQLNRIAFERDRAEAVTEFLNELFAGANSLPSRGNTVTVREILDLGNAQLQGAAALNPAITGSVYLALGRAYNALGLGEQALPLLSAAQSALDESINRLDRAHIQADIAAALDSSGRAVEAIAADDKALRLLALAPGASERDSFAIRIRKLRNHANVLDLPLPATIAELEQIVADIRALPEPAPTLEFEALAALVGAQVFANLAEPALTTATRALELGRTLYAADDPRQLRGRFVYATALMLTAPTQAIELYETLIDDHRRLIGPSQRLANTIGNLGVALSRVGRDEDSMRAFDEAADMIVDVVNRDHYLYRLSVANLAALHLRRSEAATAERLIRDILEDLNRRAHALGGVEIIYQASALNTLGNALSLQNRFTEAGDVYRQALAALDSVALPQTRPLRERIALRLAEVERIEAP